jgi:hypothetical protein
MPRFKESHALDRLSSISKARRSTARATVPFIPHNRQTRAGNPALGDRKTLAAVLKRRKFLSAL